MPKSALTGTEKKAKKLAFKTAKEQQALTSPIFKKILKGHYRPEISIGKMLKDFQKGTQGAEKIFAPIKEQALQDFNQYTQPEVVGQFGQGTSGSSAMNQALAAAKTNLSRQLASDFAGLQANLGQNFLNTKNQNKTNYLQQLLSATAGANPVLQGVSQQPSYLPSSSKPSGINRFLGAAAPIAGAGIGALLAGPGGRLAGAQLGAGIGSASGQAFLS